MPDVKAKNNYQLIKSVVQILGGKKRVYEQAAIGSSITLTLGSSSWERWQTTLGASLGHKDLIPCHVTGGSVMLSMGDSPGMVRNEEG